MAKPLVPKPRRAWNFIPQQAGTNIFDPLRVHSAETDRGERARWHVYFQEGGRMCFVPSWEEGQGNAIARIYLAARMRGVRVRFVRILQPYGELQGS